MTSTETIVDFSNIIFPASSGRGITESLSLLDNGVLRRTVNGTLTDTTRIENRKFVSQIKCSDLKTPTLADIWKGQQLVGTTTQPFRQFVNNLSVVTLFRTPLTGSVSGYNSSDVKQVLNSVVGNVATFATPVAYVKFNPVLTMLVTSIVYTNDEYSAVEGWEVDLEEV